jgi:hypothetical protein
VQPVRLAPAVQPVRLAPVILSILALSLVLSACEQTLSSDTKLRALVTHQHKMEVILADLHQDCDSAVEATLKYRTDSLLAALDHPLEKPGAANGKPGASKETPSRKAVPKKKSTSSHPGHHTHQKPSHHH